MSERDDEVVSLFLTDAMLNELQEKAKQRA